MMRNFMLLESETDHTGTTRTGPLATFDEVFKGVNYFHVRRVYRDQHGQWAPGSGISCRYEQRDALLAALLKCLNAHMTTVRWPSQQHVACEPVNGAV